MLRQRIIFSLPQHLLSVSSFFMASCSDRPAWLCNKRTGREEAWDWKEVAGLKKTVLYNKLI